MTVRGRPASALARGGVLVVALAGCSGAQPPTPLLSAPIVRPEATILHPARYLLPHAQDAAIAVDGGLAHVIWGGRRFELRGGTIVAMSALEPEIDGGVDAPGWATGAPRWVFWSGTQLLAGDTFTGPLRAIGTLPAQARAGFHWLDGAGLMLHGGALTFPTLGPARRLGIPGVVHATAADARHAILATALGHTRLTLDGGASWRDVSAELAGTVTLETRGGRMVARTADGHERAIEGIPLPSAGPSPDEAAPLDADHADPFFAATKVAPIDAAMRAGVLLDDGGVAIVEGGVAARFDPTTLRTTSVAVLDPLLREADCAPVRVGHDVLAVCVGPDRATVFSLAGAPHVERTFDVAGASELDRFVANGDEALGYLGACDGSPNVVPDVTVSSTGEPSNVSRQRSPVICVRVTGDEWVEQRLPEGDADDVENVVAWVPRAAGGATALVARAAPFLDDAARVRVVGGLRVVRLARGEPPLGLTMDHTSPGEVVNRVLRTGPDDTLRGWLAGASGAGASAVRIDARGRVAVYPGPPRATDIVHAGDLALAASDDGRLFETTDGGARWGAVEPPPMTSQASVRQPSSCSAVGCTIGAFVRLGWSGPAALGDATEPDPDLRDPREQHTPAASLAPPARLVCSPRGAARGKRVADSGAFGATPDARDRVPLTRLGALGFIATPEPGSVATDAEVAWIPPLGIRLVRRNIPFDGLGAEQGRLRPLAVGYLLARGGGLDAFVTRGARASCELRPLESVHAVRFLGGCPEEPSVGVEIGDRLVVVHRARMGLDVSLGVALREASARGAFGLALAHTTPAGASLEGFTIGVGERAGKPVVVAVGVDGAASMAPIDDLRGTIGDEETLASLADASIGSTSACTPRPDDARFVLSFQGQDLIGLDRVSLPGVTTSGGGGVAIVRWSSRRACIDAIELAVRDDRFAEEPAPGPRHGTLEKLVARFGDRPEAALVLIGLGTEITQPLLCTRIAPGGA